MDKSKGSIGGQAMFSGRITRRSALIGIAGAGAAALVAAQLPSRLGAHHVTASAVSAPADYPETAFTAVDMAFEDLPASIEGGWRRLTLHNAGMDFHHAMFMRLNDGVTVDEFLEAAKSPELEAIFALAASVGGPGSISPGQESTVILDLEPGQYVVVCIVHGPDGMPHYTMGMLQPVEVTAATSTAMAPTADVTMELVDYGFDHLPMEAAAGEQVWEVPNIGADVHELVILQLAPGVTIEQIEAMLAAPEGDAPADTPEDSEAEMAPPFAAIGGVAPVSSGETNWAVLSLDSGDYVALCVIPQALTGPPHFALGMVMPFSVK